MTFNMVKLETILCPSIHMNYSDDVSISKICQSEFGIRNQLEKRAQ